MYSVIKGDATKPTLEIGEIAVIPHVCNNEKIWGGGFVIALSKKWIEPEKEYKEYIHHNMELFTSLQSKDMILGKLACGGIGLCKVNKDICVANMIAQDGIMGEYNPTPIRYDSLIQCMTKIKDIILTFNNRNNKNRQMTIHTPKFGSLRAGGKWELVEALIKNIWVDQGIDVTVYEFEE